MAYGAWLTLVPFSLLALYYGWRAPRGGSEAPALILSAVLFLSGAITGSLIRDDSVLVPAHYHGAIGAVTLTFMAFAYRLMRELGFTGPQITQERLQLSLYGGGLLALVAGLTISGLSGVMRKVPGAEQSLEGVTSIIGMVLMGAGGFVALSATFAFAIFALRALLPAGIPTLRPSESD